MENLGFRKPKRLSRRKEIDNLFDAGKSINLTPIRVRYVVSNGEQQTKTLFTVPSKVFRRAVDRNLLKRRMREAFRVSQHQLDLPVKLHLAYIYIAKKILPFSEIEKRIIQSFKKLSSELER